MISFIWNATWYLFLFLLLKSITRYFVFLLYLFFFVTLFTCIWFVYQSVWVIFCCIVLHSYMKFIQCLYMMFHKYYSSVSHRLGLLRCLAISLLWCYRLLSGGHLDRLSQISAPGSQCSFLLLIQYNVWITVHLGIPAEPSDSMSAEKVIFIWIKYTFTLTHRPLGDLHKI